MQTGYNSNIKMGQAIGLNFRLARSEREMPGLVEQYYGKEFAKIAM